MLHFSKIDVLLCITLAEDSFPHADHVIFYALLGFTQYGFLYSKNKKAFFKLSIVVQFPNQPV